MKKKEFWKGFGCAVALVVAFSFAGQSATIQSIFPWQILPFELHMSTTAKTKLIQNFIEKYYVEDVDMDEVYDSMYAGLLDGVEDKYTYYLTADEIESYMQNTNGQFEGIGVTIFQTEEGETIIFSVVEGNAADLAGILPGDVIRAVDDVDVQNMSISEVTDLVKGSSGTDVSLTVYRSETQMEYTYVLTRSPVVVQSVNGTMLEDGVGYIYLGGFKENTYSQFMEQLEKLQAEGLDGLILDLRDNPGGLVSSVYRIADEILPEGLLVYTEDKNGNREELLCDDEYIDIPIVLLVNENSASASEILSGAAKDTGRATLVGTKTFGKGLVQRLFTLPDGSGLNITVQKYYTPNGISIHGEGITPDYVVEDTDMESDLQLEKGIEVLKEKLTKSYVN